MESKEIKNTKNTEEAKEVLNRRVKTLMEDGFIFYVEPKEEVDDKPDQLIGFVDDEDEEGPLNSEDVYYTVLAVGKDCKTLEVGDKVLVDPRYIINPQYKMVPIEDCVFTLMNERHVMLIIKD